MATLSVCMIMKNEEGVLARCLDSFHELADEIILVDTGSTDKTIEIAQKYPKVRVEHFKWIDDFGAARNHSFSFATKDLIMWLDCDDVIKPEDFKKIQRLKEQDISQLKDCYICTYAYAHDSNDNVTVTLQRERIFKRSANPRWMYRIHECVPLRNFHTNERINISIHHYKTIMQHQRAEGRNLRILKECVEDPKQNCPRYEFYYGKELSEIGHPDAEKYLKQYLSHPEYYEDAFYATYKLAHIYFNKKNWDESRKYCLDALKHDERRGDVFCFLGLIHINNQRYDLAKFWYKAALLMPKPDDSLGFFDMTYHTYTPQAQLSYVSYLTGDYEACLYHADEALKYRPGDGMANHNRNMALKALNKNMEPESRKWAIYIPFNYDSNNPNIRLRKLNIQKELERKNITAKIVQKFNELEEYDYILTHSLFTLPELEHLKAKGKLIGYDLAEGWFDDHFKNTIGQYNLITCSSSKLKRYVEKFNINAVHISDSYEVN